jgi:fructose-bisphosphate aldolase class II/tagatose 1,6-diphosphate aldolase GatY/KbaY
MLARGTGIIKEFRARGQALAAMTTYTLESTAAICRAAERARTPVIIQAGSGSFAAVGLELLAVSALSAARRSPIAIGVHLDHSARPDEIRACIELGYTSVMVDGSHLPYDDNVALTLSVVEEAHAVGVWVEAELGAIAGDEDASVDADVTGETDPAQAADFAQRTGVDALAVAVGNVHGITDRPVHLDMSRLRAIAALTGLPLVLHGASGTGDGDLLEAVAAGVAKVNFNTEIRRAHVKALAQGLAVDGDDIRRIQQRSIDAMAAVAYEKIMLLSGRPNVEDGPTAGGEGSETG